jgi:superfamily II DNA or RNA helicase
VDLPFCFGRNNVLKLIEPTKQTLRRYGLSLEEWKIMADNQGHVCKICKKYPLKGRLAIDHEHVKGWKKMPPEQRKKFVRGLLDWFCNSKVLTRGVDILKLEGALAYLKEYEAKKSGL